MEKWNIPPRVKVHEALGCIADKRVDINGNNGKVYSSTKSKFYTINYDPETNSIMSNDNSSYWVGYLGYPSITFLMVKGVISYDQKISEAFKDIKWKDINTKFKNDFTKTESYVLEIAKERGFSLDEINKEIDCIYTQIKSLNIYLLGKKVLPPKGY